MNKGNPGGSDRSTLRLWLDSLPCVSSACKRPENAPLTQAEVDAFEKYLETRSGPASNGQNRTA